MPDWAITLLMVVITAVGAVGAMIYGRSIDDARNDLPSTPEEVDQAELLNS